MTIVFLTIFIMNQILIYISELIKTRLFLLFVFYCKRITVVKELRSKMFGQHPGYFKAVFLKKTQIVIVSIYEYTVLPRSIVPRFIANLAYRQNAIRHRFSDTKVVKPI